MLVPNAAGVCEAATNSIIIRMAPANLRFFIARVPLTQQTHGSLDTQPRVLSEKLRIFHYAAAMR